MDELPIIDQAVLDELRASVGDDDAFVADLATTYVTEGAEQMRQLDAASVARDLAAMVRPAHSMKSSSASLGAARMSHIAREIEVAGREARMEVIDDLLSRARETWNLTVAELESRRLLQ